MNDLVSIITPTYNRAYILGTAIRSVIAQAHINWEMLIIDDGGTDKTKALVESFADSRLRYERIEHAGQSAARNRGLDIAQGKWITFLDSDNDFLPTFLERALKSLHAHPGALALIPKGRKTQELWENGRLVESIEVTNAFPGHSDDVAKDIFFRTFIFEPNAFIHSASVRDEGIRFDEKLHRMEDWDYAMIIAEKHPQAFLYLPEVLYTYHQRYGGDGVVSSASYADWADTFEDIYQKHKHDRLMQGQGWYPQRVEKWRKIQADFEKGLEPPPHLYYFKKRIT
jgi:glycosyltransferase involved in cell wall biosynthesis